MSNGGIDGVLTSSMHTSYTKLELSDPSLFFLADFFFLLLLVGDGHVEVNGYWEYSVLGFTFLLNCCS